MKKTLFYLSFCCYLISCNSNIHEKKQKKSFNDLNNEEITIDLNKYKNLKSVKFIGNKNLAYQKIKIDSNKTISSLYNFKKIYKKGIILNTWATFTSEGLIGNMTKNLLYDIEIEREREEGNSHIFSVYFPTDLWPKYPSKVYFGDFDNEFKGKIIDTVFFNQYGRASIRYLSLKKGKNEFFFILDVGELKRPNGRNEKIFVYGKHVENIK